MTEELEYMLNKNDFYLKEKGLLDNNWNLTLNKNNSPFNELREKNKNDNIQFKSGNDFFKNTATSSGKKSSFRNTDKGEESRALQRESQRPVSNGQSRAGAPTGAGDEVNGPLRTEAIC